MTQRETARKFGVNVYACLRDRVTGENPLVWSVPRLAELIQAQAKLVRLRASGPATQASL